MHKTNRASIRSRFAAGTAAVAVGTALATVAATPAHAAGSFTTDLGPVELVSVTLGGTGGASDSTRVDFPGSQVSADGRYVIFESAASGLVAGDTNGDWDVFLRDLTTQTTTRISVAKTVTGKGRRATTTFTQVEGSSSGGVALSADGSIAAFTSFSSELVPGQPGQTGVQDVFVRDNRTGDVTLVSAPTGLLSSHVGALQPSVSADGSTVSFSARTSSAPYQIFVYNVATGTTTLASVTGTGTDGNGSSVVSSLSADGTRLSFLSYASDLVAGDVNGSGDIFVRDLTTGQTVPATVTADGVWGDDNFASLARISGDGTKVAFSSPATNLVPDDTNGLTDIFLKDLVTGKLTRVSTDQDGRQFDRTATAPWISQDGTTVVFSAFYATDVSPGVPGAISDIFVKRLDTGSLALVSTNSDGASINYSAQFPTISTDGSQVVFQSSADNLVPEYTGGIVPFQQVYHKTLS
ncbi:TolB family protein [Frankia sp. CcWB3]